MPINETTKIFTKPGAFWGKITETDFTGREERVNEKGVSFFLDGGIDHRITENFSLQLGFNWLPNIADTNLTLMDEIASDAAGETAEIDVFRMYLGGSLLLW